MAAESQCHLLFADGRGEQVQLHGKALNSGADGTIYRSICGRFALKYFHEPDKNPQRRHKLWQMMQHPPEDSSASHFAWPQALLLGQADQLLGFAMPLLDIRSHVSLDPVLTQRGRELERLPQDSGWRLQVAINLSKRVAELHQRGHSIIDLKPANLLVHRRSADVSVVDCDGFAIQGDEDCFPAHQFTAGHIAPEAWRAGLKPEALRQSQDEFALALILFSLLNNGLHPFQGVPTAGQQVPSDNQGRIGGGFYPYGLQPHPFIKPSPWSVHRGLPRILREAFDRSLTTTERHSAAGWAELLQQAVEHMRRCSRNPDHGHWGQRCPYCSVAVNNHNQPGVTRIKVQPATLTSAAEEDEPGTLGCNIGCMVLLIMLLVVPLMLWPLVNLVIPAPDRPQAPVGKQTTPPLPSALLQQSLLAQARPPLRPAWPACRARA